MLDCLLSPKGDVRLLAMEVLQMSVVHGLVNPSPCILGLVSVQQDPLLAAPVRELMDFFSDDSERRTVFRNTAVEGVVLSYAFGVSSCARAPKAMRGCDTRPGLGDVGSVHQPLYGAMQRRKEDRTAYLKQTVHYLMKNPFNSLSERCV